MLVEVSCRLRTALRGSDTAARMGGDEFVVLLPTVAAPHDALAVGLKLLESLAQPLAHNGHAGGDLDQHRRGRVLRHRRHR